MKSYCAISSAFSEEDARLWAIDANLALAARDAFNRPWSRPYDSAELCGLNYYLGRDNLNAASRSARTPIKFQP